MADRLPTRRLGVDAGRPRFQPARADAVRRRPPARVLQRETRNVDLYYQLDVTLGAVEPSYLHVSWRRETPTVMRRTSRSSSGSKAPAASSVATSACVARRWDLVRRGRGEGVSQTATPRTRRSAEPGSRITSVRRGAWARTIPYGPARRSIAASTSASLNPISSASTAGTFPIRSCSHRHAASRSSRSVWRCSDRARRQSSNRSLPRIPCRRSRLVAHSPVGWGRYQRARRRLLRDAFVYATRPQPVERVRVADATADTARRPYGAMPPMEQMLSTAVNVEPDVSAPLTRHFAWARQDRTCDQGIMSLL